MVGGRDEVLIRKAILAKLWDTGMAASLCVCPCFSFPVSCFHIQKESSRWERSRTCLSDLRSTTRSSRSGRSMRACRSCWIAYYMKCLSNIDVDVGGQADQLQGKVKAEIPNAPQVPHAKLDSCGVSERVRRDALTEAAVRRCLDT